MKNEFYTFNNGVKIPKIGLGVYQIPDEDVANVVKSALKIGYRHIDTAYVYENERGVGEALRDCDIPREEIFLTTKIPGWAKTYYQAKKYFEESIESLGVEYIDLLLIHNYKPFEEETDFHYFDGNIVVWNFMIELYKAGKVRAIGVSNFGVVDMENLINNCEIKPVTNQIRFHVGYMQNEIVKYCEENNILVEAYSPFSTGNILNNEEIRVIAKEMGKSVSELCIAYVLQKNTVALPKSIHDNYLKKNFESQFEIPAQYLELLDKIIA